MLIRASIIGASGYTGIELVRLLSTHPQVSISHLVSETYSGQSVSAVYPHLEHLTQLKFSRLDYRAITESSDVVFLAMPHGATAPIIKQLLSTSNCRLIDLSADMRLNDGEIYRLWYQHPPLAAEILSQAVYGLAEVGYRKELANARLVANPGCYPTATILGLAPALAHDLIDLTHLPLIIDAKSGISGAGRGLKLNTHFCEAMDNFSAYQVGGIHRHIPEIEQELSKISRQAVTVNFTPHLLPTIRGMLITAYARLKPGYDLAQINQIYHAYYHASRMVRLTTATNPGTKAVIGSNFCNIKLHVDQRTNYLIIVSSIDNLLKGASGQAVQNMNLMYHLDETSGLVNPGVYP